MIADAPVSMGQEARVTKMGGYRFFAGWRSDPFFFGTMGALNNLQFAGGQDFFTEKNICGIVLEVPDAVLGPGAGFQLWARTVAHIDGKWVQAERGARPSQTPVLTGDQNTAYRAARPAGDAAFIPVFAHSLEHTGGFSTEEATRVAKTLLPDVLRYDPRRPARFPDNGRTLTDDAADVFPDPHHQRKGEGRRRRAMHCDLLADFPYVRPAPRSRPATLSIPKKPAQRSNCGMKNRPLLILAIAAVLVLWIVLQKHGRHRGHPAEAGRRRSSSASSPFW